MTGHHEVRIFQVSGHDTTELPEGWKPFGVITTQAPFNPRYVEVVCRRWVRDEKPTEEKLDIRAGVM